MKDRSRPRIPGRLPRLAAALLGGALALSGCYSKPLDITAAEDPSFKGMDMQLAQARLYNFLSDHGTVTLALPKGQACRGTWTTDKRRTFVVEPTPGDGPEGTVQLVVNYPGNELMPERARYWLDPDHEFCLGKSVEPVFDRKKESIAYVNTEVNEGFEKSPQGHWYATRTRRMTTDTDVVQVRDYYVDFDVELDSSALLTVETQE